MRAEGTINALTLSYDCPRILFSATFRYRTPWTIGRVIVLLLWGVIVAGLAIFMPMLPLRLVFLALAAGGFGAAALDIYRYTNRRGHELRITDEGVEWANFRWPWSSIAAIAGYTHGHFVGNPPSLDLTLLVRFRSRFARTRYLPTTPPFTRDSLAALFDTLEPHLASHHPHVRLGPVVPEPEEPPPAEEPIGPAIDPSLSPGVFFNRTFEYRTRDSLYLVILGCIVSAISVHSAIRGALFPLAAFIAWVAAVASAAATLRLLHRWATRHSLRLRITEHGVTYGDHHWPWDAVAVIGSMKAGRGRVTLHLHPRRRFTRRTLATTPHPTEREFRALMLHLQRHVSTRIPAPRVIVEPEEPSSD